MKQREAEPGLTASYQAREFYVSSSGVTTGCATWMSYDILLEKHLCVCVFMVAEWSVSSK